MSFVPDDYVDRLKALPSIELINEMITGQNMQGIREDSDALLFCDAMDNYSDNVTSKQFIASLRNGMDISLSRKYISLLLHT